MFVIAKRFWHLSLQKGPDTCKRGSEEDLVITNCLLMVAIANRGDVTYHSTKFSIVTKSPNVAGMTMKMNDNEKYLFDHKSTNSKMQ